MLQPLLSRRGWLCVLLITGGCALDSGRSTGPGDGAVAVAAGPADAGVAMPLRCGDHDVEVRRDGEGLRLSVDGVEHRLVPVVSASGARYVAADESAVGFWNKGDSNLLEIGGEAVPCAEAAVRMLPYRGRGNEPGWQVTVTAERCTDSMTGMPYPDTVTLSFQGQTYSGCGGDPATLLQRHVWQVVAVAGTDLMSEPAVTMRFGGDGRVSGRSGCNRYSGSFRVGGEALEVGAIAGTRMACAPDVNALEARFLELLGAARTFALDDAGTLILRTADGRAITARAAEATQP